MRWATSGSSSHGERQCEDGAGARLDAGDCLVGLDPDDGAEQRPFDRAPETGYAAEPEVCGAEPERSEARPGEKREIVGQSLVLRDREGDGRVAAQH